MKIYNLPIQKEKLPQFHEILIKIGGKYLCNPEKRIDKYGYWRVSFELETVEAQKRWYNCRRFFEKEVVEVNKTQWWRILLNRIKSIFKGYP